MSSPIRPTGSFTPLAQSESVQESSTAKQMASSGPALKKNSGLLVFFRGFIQGIKGYFANRAQKKTQKTQILNRFEGQVDPTLDHLLSSLTLAQLKGVNNLLTHDVQNKDLGIFRGLIQKWSRTPSQLMLLNQFLKNTALISYVHGLMQIAPKADVETLTLTCLELSQTYPSAFTQMANDLDQIENPNERAVALQHTLSTLPKKTKAILEKIVTAPPKGANDIKPNYVRQLFNKLPTSANFTDIQHRTVLMLLPQLSDETIARLYHPFFSRKPTYFQNLETLLLSASTEKEVVAILNHPKLFFMTLQLMEIGFDLPTILQLGKSCLALYKTFPERADAMLSPLFRDIAQAGRTKQRNSNLEKTIKALTSKSPEGVKQLFDDADSLLQEIIKFAPSLDDKTVLGSILNLMLHHSNAEKLIEQSWLLLAEVKKHQAPGSKYDLDTITHVNDWLSKELGKAEEGQALLQALQKVYKQDKLFGIKDTFLITILSRLDAFIDPPLSYEQVEEFATYLQAASHGEIRWNIGNFLQAIDSLKDASPGSVENSIKDDIDRIVTVFENTDLPQALEDRLSDIYEAYY